MKTSFVVIALIMLVVATNGADFIGKPRFYVSSKRNVDQCNLQKVLNILAHERIPNYITTFQNKPTN